MSDTKSKNSGEEDAKPQKRPNDRIRHFRTWEQVERIQLDHESPMFREACYNLGIEIFECKKITQGVVNPKYKKKMLDKGMDEDVVELRYKHY